MDSSILSGVFWLSRFSETTATAFVDEIKELVFVGIDPDF
jgi:hypothetical protein